MPQNNNKKPNPISSLILSLSRMPPAVMLLIIIGLAGLTTMMVTGKVNQQENELKQQNAEAAMTQQDFHDSGTARKKVFYSATMISQGSTIERRQIKEKNLPDLEVWDDAVADVTSIVGRKPKKDIPLNAQIRQSDLESISQ